MQTCPLDSGQLRPPRRAPGAPLHHVRTRATEAADAWVSDEDDLLNVFVCFDLEVTDLGNSFKETVVNQEMAPPRTLTDKL